MLVTTRGLSVMAPWSCRALASPEPTTLRLEERWPWPPVTSQATTVPGDDRKSATHHPPAHHLRGDPPGGPVDGVGVQQDHQLGDEVAGEHRVDRHGLSLAGRCRVRSCGWHSVATGLPASCINRPARPISALSVKSTIAPWAPGMNTPSKPSISSSATAVGL